VSVPSPEARVSVVIVNYQSYPELRACLASLDEGATRHAVVVVDYESDDAQARRAEEAFPHVRILRVSRNAGFAAGVNRGARETRGRYLLLLNPDSVPEPGLCDALAGWMDANPSVGVVGPRIRNANGSVQASARRFPDFTTAIAGRSSWLTRIAPRNPLSRHNLPGLDAPTTGSLRVDWVSGACMFVRREAFEAIGGMDEGFFLYWEDADFCRRLKHAGWQTMYYPGAAAVHLGGGSSRHAVDASLVAFHRSAYRLFRKHASAPLRLLSPVVFAALRVRLAFMRHVVRARARAVAELSR
jgi:N-acetylglucosaminyl-diphospho-decaprenol L-rhamnosyltransferase